MIGNTSLQSWSVVALAGRRSPELAAFFMLRPVPRDWWPVRLRSGVGETTGAGPMCTPAPCLTCTYGRIRGWATSTRVTERSRTRTRFDTPNLRFRRTAPARTRSVGVAASPASNTSWWFGAARTGGAPTPVATSRGGGRTTAGPASTSAAAPLAARPSYTGWASSAPTGSRVSRDPRTGVGSGSGHTARSVPSACAPAGYSAP